MHFSKKLFLLPTLCLLGFTSAHAMDVDPIEKKPSSVSRKARVSLVLPDTINLLSLFPVYTNTTTMMYEITFTGTRSGNKWMGMAFSTNTIHRHFTFSEDLDLYQFYGDVRVSVVKQLLPRSQENPIHPAHQGKFNLSTKHIENIGFQAKTEAIFIRLNPELTEAKVVTQHPKCLVSLALAQTIHNIVALDDDKYAWSSIRRTLPQELRERFPEKTWKNRSNKTMNVLKKLNYTKSRSDS